MRIAAFAGVGMLGFCLQMLVVSGLIAAGWPYLIATAVGVEAAVLHNFVWHERWTWADRTGGSPGPARRLLRFNLTTGLTSIAGNLGFTALYVGQFGLTPVAANVLAVASTTLANFLVADRYVFGRAAFIVIVLGGATRADAADIKPETIAAWNQYVQAEEARPAGAVSEDDSEHRAGRRHDAGAVRADPSVARCDLPAGRDARPRAGRSDASRHAAASGGRARVARAGADR